MNGEPLLKARDVAELLGLELATVVERFQRGDLPGFRLYGNRPGSPLRFRLSEIEAWLENDCRPDDNPVRQQEMPRSDENARGPAPEVKSDATRILRPVHRV